jgi:FkbH-like protein
MYETEANRLREGSDQLPNEIVQAFSESKQNILSRSVLPWSEHCTECVWPTCYTTCDLYTAREDGRCRRFANGMVRIDAPGLVNSYILKIQFKRWGKLWSPGNVSMHPFDRATTIERRDYELAKVVRKIPLPAFVRIAATQKRYGYKNRRARRKVAPGPLPTCFFLECYNPSDHSVRLSLTMRPTNERSKMPYQRLVDVTPGFHRLRIPIEEITALLPVREPFDIELVPNEELKETTLYFGLMDFVVEATKSATKKIKCVVWDLDHTVWDGVLVEDGIENVKLKPGISAVIEALDARGILHSIASKNNLEDAMLALSKFGLADYVLFPQISWSPKSQAIQAIAQHLNIGLNSLLFIDDSKFEREEVKAVCPEVRTLPAEEYNTLSTREEFQGPVTEESKARRKLYQVEMTRQTLAQSFSHDYMAFLRHCQIRLTMRPMTEENLERVHELTQRTNQMNFSGNRYDRDVLKILLSNPDLDTFVLSCEDRFGSYGVIGFSIVDRREPRMTDLMFSCRIQSKRVEHAFLAHVIRKYLAETGQDFYANYRKTPRNAPSGQVFADLLMEEVETHDGVSLLRFPKDCKVPDDKVIEILVPEAAMVQPA